MSTTRAYRGTGRRRRSEETRERIVAAVRDLLAEGRFHSATVEEVADRAGIARATLYQHFRSRLDLVDAICATFDANPALLAIRDTVALDDADAAVDQTLAQTVRFWSSEDAVLAELYGVVAIDPAAEALVARQRQDRHGEMLRLAATLRRAGRLRKGTTRGQAVAALMVVTSYETFRELREAGQKDPQIARTLQGMARALILVDPASGAGG